MLHKLNKYFLLLSNIIIFSFLVSCQETRAQVNVDGIVVDDSTSIPLSYANVKIQGAQRGTATNEGGVFTLSVDSLPVRIAVSHLGYETVERQIRAGMADSAVVHLPRSSVEMEELVVEGQTALHVVQNTIEHLKVLKRENSKTELTEGAQAFYRQKTKSNDVYTEYVETFYNVFISPFGVRNWSINQGRYGIIDDARESDKFIIHTDLSKLTRWLSVPCPQSSEGIPYPLCPEATDKFTYEIDCRIKHEGEELVEISYTPREEDEVGYRGRLFINTESYALHRFEGKIRHPRSHILSTNNKKTWMENTKVYFSMSFTPFNNKPITYVDQVNFEISYDYVKENTFRRRTKTKSTFLVYDYNPDETFGTSPIENDYAAIDSVEYDPKFWRNNPVLARTPVDEDIIRSFEETGGFGRFVEKRVGSE